MAGGVSVPSAAGFSLVPFLFIRGCQVLLSHQMPLVDPTAKQLSFQKYYHYQPFCRDHLTTLLRDKKLFFSDPDTFNDPWDCKPWFDYRPMLEDPVKREEMIAFLRCLVSPEMLANPLRAVYEDSLRRDNDALIKDVETYSRGLGEQIRKRRVYCLSVLPESMLMWSHYSENHRGICLEFDKNNALIGKARPVRYRGTYPELTPQGAVNANDPLELIFAKSKDWSYEREFRIMGSLLDGPTKLYGNFVLLPPVAITSIILGCESRDHDEVLGIIGEYAPGLPIKRVVRVPNHYKLTITA